jgi:ABC-type nitrate/sulfonate/bicarbonate transport system permease component
MKLPTLVGIVGVIVLGVVLEVLIKAGTISPFLIAPPSEIGVELVGLWHEERLIEALLLTIGSSLASISIGIMLGVPIGYFLHRNKLLAESYEKWIAGMFSAPLILLYPLFLVLFGRGVQTIIAISSILATIPIILNTLQAFAGVRTVHLNVARAFKLTPWQTFWKVLLPAAMPTIFTGIRLGLIYAMISVVAIEYLVVLGGLGSLVSDLYDRYNIAGMYAAILAVIAVTVMFFKLATEIERWLRPM